MEGSVDSVTLEFLDPVTPTPVIEVTGPDGRPVAGLEEVELVGDDVARVRFAPVTEPGDYRVDYTFVALDGATQEGAHQFTFEPGSGVEVRPLLAVLVGVVLAGLLAAAVIGRRRSRS